MSSEFVRARFLFKEVTEKGFDLPLGSVTKDGGVEFRSDLNVAVWNPGEDVSNYKRVRPDDFVIGLRSFQSGIGRSSIEALVSPAYTVLRPISENIHPPFFRYLFKSSAYISRLENVAQGIRQGRTISTEDFYNIEVRRPSINEQKAIADFLDRETMLIDSLVERKSKLIEVLTERQAEFERSVVAGVREGSHANRRMTGNSLIPNIPNNWKLIRARFLCSIDTGSSDTDESEDVGMYPFFVRSQTPNLSNRYIFDTEAVLTAGDGAGVGKVFHHFEGKFDAHQRVYVMHNFKGITGRFFFYFFSSFFGIAALDGSAKSTVDSVRRHMISELPVVVPPLEEQVRLTRILDDSRKKMELTSTLLRQQVIRLRDRREALISAAVTGELEIPEVAA